MELNYYTLEKDLLVYVKKAESFPMGVKAAFQYMHGLVPYDPKRMYLGLSKVKEDGMDYWAGSPELQEGEFQKHELETILLPAGEYAYFVINDYMEHLDQIGPVFEKLMDEIQGDPNAMGLEWYVDMKELWIMLKK